MNDQIIFYSRADAEKALDAMKDIASTYHSVSIQDYRDIVGITEGSSCYDYEIGWANDMVQNAKVVSSVNRKLGKIEYAIELPIPTNIIQSASLDSNIKIYKEENTMGTATNKICNYTTTPEELEREKAIKEATEETEKKIMDIRIELSKKLEAIRTEYHEKEAIKREERQAHAWKRRYDALLKEGFSTEQAWEMTMEAFKCD